LGDYLASRGWAVCIDQKGFSLMDALAAAKGEWGEQGAGEGIEMDIPGGGEMDIPGGREMDISAGRQLPDPAAGDGLLRQAIAEVLAMVGGESRPAR